MIPAKTSTSPGDLMHVSAGPRRLRNPDQLRRREHYHRAVGEFRNVSFDNKPQLKGRLTPSARVRRRGNRGSPEIMIRERPAKAAEAVPGHRE